MTNFPPAWTGKTHADLISAFKNLQNNYVLGMAFPDLVPNEEWPKLEKKILIVFSENGNLLSLPMQEFSKQMSDPAQRTKMLNGFHKSHKRSAAAEGHELLLSYCGETGQLAKYKNVGWYQFARIVRNAASHSIGGLIQWPNDIGVAKVSWRHHTFEKSMEGTELNLGPLDTYQLLADQLEFASTQLA